VAYYKKEDVICRQRLRETGTKRDSLRTERERERENQGRSTEE
jgi:hypothetical protein